MSDQDNLRNRIAAKILDNFNPPDDKHPSWWINPEVSAQAIIDELGLTVETRVGYDASLDRDVLERFGRVIGKWEPECHR